MIVLSLVLQSLLWMILWVAPNLLVFWVVYYVLSLPLRRQERARFFLDLMEGCLQQGTTPEQGIVALSRTRDRSLGVRFHWLAAWVESGLSMQQALARVPGFLPSRVQGQLEIGFALGDLRRVLPVCRRVTTDALSAVQGASNYVVLSLLALSPFAAWALGLLSVYVLPKFVQIADDMEVEMPWLVQWLSLHAGWLLTGIVLLSLVVYGFAVLYVAGPYVSGWLRRRGYVWPDWLAWQLPWRRRRLQRDYAALLALLLDGGMPEGEALALTGRCVPSAMFRVRTERARHDLERGQPLADALRHVDDSGELAWRLRNAAGGRGGFRGALEGWFEALDARAYQQEQVAMQLTTTALVLFNGVLVGLVVVGVFQPLIAVIHSTALW